MGFLSDSDITRNAATRREEVMLRRKQRQASNAVRQLRSDDVKIDTIKTFLALGGNLSLTSGATGIPYVTLKSWKATQWWNDVITELRKADKLELSASTKKILTKSLALLEDRLEKGDYIYDQKKGTLIRKPLQAKDLHKIAIDMMERKDKLDEGASSQNVSESNEDKMQVLMKRFAELAVKAAEKQLNKNTGEVIDLPFRENNSASDES